MAIPTYDKLFRPVLELASAGPVTRRSATDELTKTYELSQEEIEQKLASGGSTFANRVGWAMTFLTKANLIEKVAFKTYRATNQGVSFLKNHRGAIREADLAAIPGYHEAWAAGSAKRREKQLLESPKKQDEADEASTPHEVITREVASLQDDLRGRLLQTIVDQTPEFFERLVLDVLTAIGYGGTREDAAEHLGRSGDEGIDGRINQDALGLDQVLVQAKRYRPDRVVDRKEVQAFIGSLSGQGVTKGVFITTSSFVSSAHEFVLRGSTTKVVLVDGKMLIDLMCRHKIGVRAFQTYEIQELDQNYFEESE